MKYVYYFMLCVICFSCKTNKASQQSSSTKAFEPIEMTNTPLSYPDTKKDSIIDQYFDTSITDYYRWLEDDLSTETATWVGKQNEVTNQYLSTIDFRPALRNRLEELYNYEKLSSPFKEGDYTYYYKNDGLQNQSVLYRKKEASEEVFLDPNQFSKDGTTSLSGVYFTKDGSKAAYLLSEGGSDWRKAVVIDTESKDIIEDTLVNIKFSGIAWHGNDGFYYSSYPKPEGSELSAKTDQHILYYHKLGSPQSEDIIIFGDTEEETHRYVSGYLTENEQFLVITAANTTSGNRLFVKDIENDGKLLTAMPKLEYDCYVLDNVENKLLISTNYDAPNSRVISVDANQPSYELWKDVIPETNQVLNASTGGKTLFAKYLKDALTHVEQYDYNGNKIRTIDLPGNGSANGFYGKQDQEEIYFSFTNYSTPSSIYQLNVKTGKYTSYWSPSIDFDPSLFESKQVFYTSKDGSQIPMMITYKKGITLDGSNPTILYSYGGFNISLLPSYNSLLPAWLEQGGIYAVPNIRGGGEYGKEWHKAGTKMQKQNVFDDFIAAAEYLIDNKYTSSEKLAISGRSNGGLLVGATMTQRPDLMKVALPGVGVLDMLRYHTFTAGAGWAYDYGTAEESKEMFDYLLNYSPVHNVKNTNYPATMVYTADHDDRVVPAHSYKFISELQSKQQSELPVLIRIETNSGHGAGKPTAKILDEWADIYSFTMYNLGVKPNY